MTLVDLLDSCKYLHFNLAVYARIIHLEASTNVAGELTIYVKTL